MAARYKSLNECSECNYQGSFSFSTLDDEDYGNSDELGSMMEAQCPSCGCKENVLITPDSFKEMIKLEDEPIASSKSDDKTIKDKSNALLFQYKHTCSGCDHQGTAEFTGSTNNAAGKSNSYSLTGQCPRCNLENHIIITVGLAVDVSEEIIISPSTCKTEDNSQSGKPASNGDLTTSAYVAWHECNDCKFQGMFPFDLIDGEDYTDEEAMVYMLNTRCPSCGYEESVMIGIEQFQEIIAMAHNRKRKKV